MALRLNDASVREKGRGRLQLAKALCERALDIFEKTAVPDHPELAAVLLNYAEILRRICPSMSRDAALLENRAEAIRANHPPDERFFPSNPSTQDARIKSGTNDEER